MVMFPVLKRADYLLRLVIQDISNNSLVELMIYQFQFDVSKSRLYVVKNRSIGEPFVKAQVAPSCACPLVLLYKLHTDEETESYPTMSMSL
jgi:hypothetical protein